MKSKLKKLFSSIANPPRDAFKQQQRRDQARDLHRQGDLEAAFSLYRNLLDEHPDDEELLYGFGNLRMDQGFLVSALESYDRAIAKKADYSKAYCNRAVVLGLLNKPEDALVSYNHAIDIDPADSIASCNRAVLLMGLGQKEAALDGFNTTLQHDATNFTAHFGRGALLQERKMWQDSLYAYDNAIATKPRDPAAHHNRAVVAKELKRWDEALLSCNMAIALNPAFSPTFAKRAEILIELKRYPAALESFDQAIALNSGDAATFNNRGVLRQSMEQLKEALADYDQAIVLNKTNTDAWLNRGAVLRELGDLNGALVACERAIELQPDHAAAYVNRGNTLHEKRLVREAAFCYAKAIALNPEFPEAHYNLSHALLALGDYARGWSEHEWRWRAKTGAIYREKRNFPQPLWLGNSSVEAMTILLYAEQGLGDCLQFCRYTQLVADKGARVIVEVPRPLVRLLTTLPGVERVVAFGDPLPHFDVQCPFMSLPLAFHTTKESIPFSTAYLKVEAAKMAEWRQRLGAKTKPRVGLSWSGNRTAGTNRKRHFTLASLLPFLPTDFAYFCLQTDIAVGDQDALENSDIFQFEGALDDFSDSAALCACMDLIISVDTSVAHLACALGVRTWILLTWAADWRWLVDREDSPWYDSAVLFRQTSPDDWFGVFERVLGKLRVAVFDSA